MGWHFAKRVDFNAGYSFTAPTGRYTAGSQQQRGFRILGQRHNQSGTTLYITKNQGTTANLATAWEIHGQKTVASTRAVQQNNTGPGLHRSSGEFGQVLPLEKRHESACPTRTSLGMTNGRFRTTAAITWSAAFRSRRAGFRTTQFMRSAFSPITFFRRRTSFLLQVLRRVFGKARVEGRTLCSVVRGRCRCRNRSQCPRNRRELLVLECRNRDWNVMS